MINFLIGSGILFWIFIFLTTCFEISKKFKKGVEDRILSLLTYEDKSGRDIFDQLEEEGYMPVNSYHPDWLTAFYHLMSKMQEDGLVTHEDREKVVCDRVIKERWYFRLWITQ